MWTGDEAEHHGKTNPRVAQIAASSARWSSSTTTPTATSQALAAFAVGVTRNRLHATRPSAPAAVTTASAAVRAPPALHRDAIHTNPAVISTTTRPRTTGA